MKTYFFLLVLFPMLAYSQPSNEVHLFSVDKFATSLIALDFNAIPQYTYTEEHKNLQKQAISLSEILYKAGQEPHEPVSLIEKKEPSIAVIFNLLQWGHYQLYYHPNQPGTIRYFVDALDLSKQLQQESLVKLSLLAILEFYHFEFHHTNNQYQNYLKEYQNLVSTPAEKAWYAIYNHYFNYQQKPILDAPNYKESQLEITLNNTSKDNELHWPLLALVAFELESNNDLEKAKASYMEVIENNRKKPYFNYLLFRSYYRLTQIYILQQKYEVALTMIDSAKVYTDQSDASRGELYLHYLRGEVFAHQYNFKNAYASLKNYDSLRNEINFKDNSLMNSALEIELKTAEKEKQLLLEKQKKIENRNLSYALGGSLFLGSIILLLVFKNRSKKQALAEQQQQLKTQQLANQLKELELKAIDAMIEGQEKERQRIAHDLHDDLGGLMATVKLHFTAFQQKNTPELYTKTNQLIDEAYQKIRSIAHAKNAGVIAKQGLLKAVQHMAEKIASTNQLHIEVLDHGLDERLENSLELTLFRIIQELLTNIIKHAEATEVSIHLTHHEESLNIMVEDNGKGFNPSQITKTNAGMGISSIDKRIEFLGGTLTIESEINKGSTVIIDIPL